MENEKPTGGFTPERAKIDKTDWTRVRAMTESELESAIADDADEAEMQLDWSKATLVLPDQKTTTIRLDSDVLDFYRGMGRGFQTTINAVLRSYMDHAKR